MTPITTRAPPNSICLMVDCSKYHVRAYWIMSDTAASLVVKTFLKVEKDES